MRKSFGVKSQRPVSSPTLTWTSWTVATSSAEVLPGHPLAAHIDDFLTDLANANKPRNTIRAYRGDLVAFAAHHDGEIGEVPAAPGAGVPEGNRGVGLSA